MLETKIKKGVRVTLTKAQKETALGIELLALCQSIGEDGRLTDEEISELKAWAEANDEDAFPAITFLTELVNSILEDKVVTEDERKALFLGVERILPKDIRELVSTCRRTVEFEERARNRIISAYDFMVAGARRKENQEVIRGYIREGQDVYLIRDPANRADKNAVELHGSSGRKFGFVPRELAKSLGPELDRGCQYKAYVKKMLGHRYDIPVICINVYRPDCRLPNLISPDFRPEVTGCMVAAAVLMIGLLATPVAFIFWIL